MKSRTAVHTSDARTVVMRDEHSHVNKQIIVIAKLKKRIGNLLTPVDVSAVCKTEEKAELIHQSVLYKTSCGVASGYKFFFKGMVYLVKR